MCCSTPTVQRDKATYTPLNTLKRVCEDVWVVDGPLIRFGMPWPKLSFPTRMTIIRLPGRELFIHSPTPLVPELGHAIDREGQPRWLIGPNRIHYWWLPEWHAGFPEAQVYVAPRIREQARDRIDFPAVTLVGDHGYPWDHDVATLPVPGTYMTEFVFFHHVSRTLVLTDLIENFEPGKLTLMMRWLTRLGGVQHPDGRTPRDLRLTFSRGEVRAAVERMIAWDPKRIILAHGRWHEKNGAAELRRAFRWLLT
jgi:Domain of unknown function (DUF4336)